MQELKKGKLIVIEGVDGCGKQTQTQLLYKTLLKHDTPVKQLSYPRYDNTSSSMVKKYLNGDFGTDAKAISPYIASTFYAADRYASYKEDYENFLRFGGTVVADRYTTANMVHQAGKISDKKERDIFLDWLYDYEFNLLGLPVPDLVIFLSLPVNYSQKLMAERNNKITDKAKKDIHEADTSHLIDAYNGAVYVAEKYNWNTITCLKNGKLRSIDDIHQEIIKIVTRKLKESEK